LRAGNIDLTTSQPAERVQAMIQEPR